MAEAVRFELTVGLPTPVFKTGTLNHSVTSPLAIDKAVPLQKESHLGVWAANCIQLPKQP